MVNGLLYLPNYAGWNIGQESEPSVYVLTKLDLKLLLQNLVATWNVNLGQTQYLLRPKIS